MKGKMYQEISRLLMCHNHCLLVSGKVFSHVSQQNKADMSMCMTQLPIGGFAREEEKVIRKASRYREQTLINLLQSLALLCLLKRGVIENELLTNFSAVKTNLIVIMANSDFIFNKL